MQGNYAIPEAMTAVVLTAPGEYEIRDDVTVPQPGYQEVLCKVMAVAICGTDPKVLRGRPYHQCPTYYPFIAGHEWSGVVVKAGEGVFGLEPGDRVAGEAHRGCGVCRNCKEGRYSICLNYGKPETGHSHYGFMTFGTYAQYVKCHIGSLTKIPDKITFAEASMCDTAGVAFHGLERAGVTPGGTVCVIGPGPIGLMAMKIARALGAAKVIAVGRGARLQAALDLGAADIGINFEQSDPVEEVMRLTGGIGVDHVYEASGAEGALPQSIRMAKEGGTIAMLGTPPEGYMESIPMKTITIRELAIFGSRANPNVTSKVVSLMESGQLNVKEMITHTFPLTAFTEGMDTFVKRKGNAVKVVFFPNGTPDE